MENATVYRDDQTGQVKRTFASRMEQFRDRYPLTMYSLIRRREVSQLTMPNLTGQQLPAVEFTCTLMHGKREVVSASSLQAIEGNKSYEMGETNALQRMLEALGFGRDLTDADELAQAEAMLELRNKPRHLHAVEASSVSETPASTATAPAGDLPRDVPLALLETGVDATAVDRAGADDHREPVGVEPTSSGEKFVPIAPAAPPKTENASVLMDKLGIRLSLKNQVVQRALALGRPVPEFTSKEQFDQFREDVMGVKAKRAVP